MYKKLAIILLSAPALNSHADNPNVIELDEIVVNSPLPTSTSKFARPATILFEDELRTKIGTSIGDTLKNEPGITSQSFGPGVGTPVIRGQSGSRVRVMQNGLGNNDVSSLSPDGVGLDAKPLRRG
jgi:iron complex outermembrane receptor protein